MEWIDRLNEVIQYIEQHLTDEQINYDTLAAIACCSTYHFQRMFTYMAGIPLSEYIRRRKMSLAAVQLQTTDEKIIDIALKFGYNSPTAFNRAFQNIHGLAPSAVRKSNVTLKSYPSITFKMIIKGVEEMNYRIEKKEAFRIVGLASPLSNSIEENFKEVPVLWQKLSEQNTIARLMSLMDGQPMGLLGISTCSNLESWRYYIAVSSSQPALEGMEEAEIGAYTWAIFSGEGACPQAIQALESRIVTEWLPTSGYEYDNGPDVEVYLTPDPANAKFEVWIPVKAKSS